MNNNLHPDTLYELNKLYQAERLAVSDRLRPFNTQQSNSRSLTDRGLLLCGNLFIAVGKNLKRRAAHQVCEPQTI